MKLTALALLTASLSACCPKVSESVRESTRETIQISPPKSAKVAFKDPCLELRPIVFDTTTKQGVRIEYRYTPGKPVEIKADCPPDTTKQKERVVYKEKVVHQQPFFHWRTAAIVLVALLAIFVAIKMLTK